MRIDWSEFLKNESGKESADRLMLVLSYPIASYLALKIGTVEALGVYLAAYGALAANNKWAAKNASTYSHTSILETPSDSSGADGSVDTRQSDGQPKVRKGKAGSNSAGGKTK